MKTNFRKINRIAPLIFAGLLILSSCESKKPVQNETTTAITTDIALAKSEDYPIIHSFSGQLEAEKQSNLSTRMMGEVERVYVNPGQRVNKGELLLEIRNQDILAQKAQVEANKGEAVSAYSNAEKNLNRFEALYAIKSASDKEIDDIRTNYQMAKARLEAVTQMEKEIEESIRYTTIRAPYSGTITGKYIQEGDMANPGVVLLSMESPTQWKVSARIPESNISHLKLNDPVKVKFNALNDLEVDGIISEINPSATNTGNQFEAKILLSDNTHSSSLYSGMYANIIYENGTQPLILIPQSALVKRGQLTGIYAVSQDGYSLLRWIRTGKTYGSSVEVLSGLSNGEKYIQSYDGKLVDGALVENK